MPHSIHPLSLAVMLALATQAGLALAAEPPQAPVGAEAELSAITVSASALALGSGDMASPVNVVEGEDLVRRREATLGATLEREPGITATHFGAGASRPVIRGMDSARVKLLSDGAEVMDASTVSPDHAVALEPMLARQVEVVRGPSALAYGGGAIGGVVNVLDNKIPTVLPRNGLEGSVELRGNTAANEMAGAVELTAGSGNVAVHVEGLKRDARDYRVGDGWAEGRRVEGSFNETETGSLGLSWIGDRGYLGLAYTQQRSDYGLPGHGHALEDCHAHGDRLHCGTHEGEDDHDDAEHAGEARPFVKLDSKRWDLRGEYLEPFAGFASLRVRASHTDYGHDEIEDGVVGTRFRSQAHDARVELEHSPLGGFRGVFGVQSSARDFSAVGDEAYVQPTLTNKHALYLVEEFRTGAWRLEAGLRHEWQHIDVDAAALPDRSHRGTSASVGAVWNFAPQYALGVSLSRAQRLPTAEELYADGPHAATGTIERGNPDLKPEASHNLDLSLKKLAGETTFSVAAFHNKVSDYIYARTLDAAEDAQLIEYTQRDATFTGIEGQVRQQLNPMFGLTLFGDYVRARLSAGDGDRDLPRIPAQRLGLRLDGKWQGWRGEVEWYRVNRQHDVAAFESETAGHNMLNLGVSYSGRYQQTPYLFYVKASNLGDELAYSHTSFIKNAAPLTGRNLTTGIRVSF
ncbi:MAG: TonB-dependent receptor [Thauera sp.]|nr:TonB-dependent receptor [Thauera sp.]